MYESVELQANSCETVDFEDHQSVTERIKVVVLRIYVRTRNSQLSPPLQGLFKSKSLKKGSMNGIILLMNIAFRGQLNATWSGQFIHEPFTE